MADGDPAWRLAAATAAGYLVLRAVGVLALFVVPYALFRLG